MESFFFITVGEIQETVESPIPELVRSDFGFHFGEVGVSDQVSTKSLQTFGTLSP